MRPWGKRVQEHGPARPDRQACRTGRLYTGWIVENVVLKTTPGPGLRDARPTVRRGHVQAVFTGHHREAVLRGVVQAGVATQAVAQVGNQPDQAAPCGPTPPA